MIEALGSVTGIYNIEPSSNGGINSDPMERSIGTVMSNAMTLIAIVILRYFSTQWIIGSYIRIKNLVIGFAVSSLKLPRMSIVINTGISVITTAAEAIMTNVFVYARGWNIFPSCPVNKKTGRKPTRIINSEKKIALPTCFADMIEISRYSSFVK